MESRRTTARASGAEPEHVDVPPYNERVGPLAYEDRRSGPPLAAVLSAGIGSFVLGLFTTLAEASPALKEWLQFRAPVGPLSGKTTLAVAAWAIAWVILGLAWRKRDVDFRTVLIATAVLVGLGLIGTYPSFFEQFATE